MNPNVEYSNWLDMLNKKVDYNKFVLALNGEDVIYKNLTKDIFKHSKEKEIFFIAQTELFDFLFNNKISKQVYRALYHDGIDILFSKGNILFFGDFIPWVNFFMEQNVSFSFGSRIHGNIVALLAKTPACVYTTDLRTKELCDFFCIPSVDQIKKKINRGGINMEDLYKLYLQLDYNKFVISVKNNAENFKKFMADIDFPYFEDISYIEKYIKQITYKDYKFAIDKNIINSIKNTDSFKIYQKHINYKNSFLYKLLHLYFIRRK